MSARKKPGNFTQRLLRKIWQSFNALTKAFVNWILRSSLVLNRRSRYSRAGFVLPTVVMVILVVILLTTAILIRSFDRSKNASNYRVNEVVLNAATPALDRARAKLEQLFSRDENRLQGNTPEESNIAEVLANVEYTFGDETRVTVVAELTGNNAIDRPEEQLQSAWKFPADTDNNGKFDSLTLYGIYFRNPPETNGNPTRSRGAVEARALPMEDVALGDCASGGGGSGTPGWYDKGGKQKKAFFTYVANLPLDQNDVNAIVAQNAANAGKYEPYKGNKGFSGLEMQQDQSRASLDNNAVWYEDDLVVYNAPPFTVNGRIHTNSNLMLAGTGGDPITLYQVSSRNSCFYDPENAKIIVGGNVAAGDIADADTGGDGQDSNDNLVKIHLFKGKGANFAEKYVKADNKTTTLPPPKVASNSAAFGKRLSVLVNGALTLHDQAASTAEQESPTPASVKRVFSDTNPYTQDIPKDFDSKYPEDDPNTAKAIARNLLQRTLTTYFQERIRRVSFVEVPFTPDTNKAIEDGGTVLSSENPPLNPGERFVFSGGFQIPEQWALIENPASGNDVANYTKVPLRIGGNGAAPMDLETTDPTDIEKDNFGYKIEYNIGDRIQVGNGLPKRWLDKKNEAGGNPFVKEGKAQKVTNGAGTVGWNDKNGGGNQGTRLRYGLADTLEDLGDTSRGGFWEQAAANAGVQVSQEDEKLLGGLRVITGAGIYVDDVRPALGGIGQRLATIKLGNPTLNDNLARRNAKSFLPIPPTVKQLKDSGVTLPQDAKDDGTDIVVWPDTMPMYDWKDIVQDNAYTPNTGEVLKGDLQMRATVVYHAAVGEAGADQEPIACISSYYDPTNSETAYNATGLPLADAAHPLGVSNNGVNYSPNLPSRAAAASDPRLVRQSRLLFPNGRWVNEPLKIAIEHLKAGVTLTLADNAAIDAANCALSIIAPGASPQANAFVPDGAIKERAFLDARQVKALHKLNFSGQTPANATELQGNRLTDIANKEQLKIAESITDLTDTTLLNADQLPKYNLPIEQRQPLEVRVTEINLGERANGGIRDVSVKPATGTGLNDDEEFMVPNSGIIYASRDDALRDISDDPTIPDPTDPTKKRRVYPPLDQEYQPSAADFKLDATRRPNGVRLINGSNLARKTQDRTPEKGLILASNLPVYIKGDFNLHLSGGTTVEEFNPVLPANYSDADFYNRANKDKRFACRTGRTGCTAPGDQWRTARILSDAVTLLSADFRDGFRNEGDYNFNNNAGNLAVETRLKNGFWWNGFATTATSNLTWFDNLGLPTKDFDADATGDQKSSSYVTNAVTPVQRRANFPQYLMESCNKVPVSECGPQDWFVGSPTGAVALNPPKKALDIVDQPNALDPTTLPNKAGTTSQPPTGTYSSYVRRVAFKRDQFGSLELPPTCSATTAKLDICDAIPIGVKNDDKSPYSVPYKDSGITPALPLALEVPPAKDNALWYWTTSDATGRKPSDTPSYTSKTTKLWYAPDDPEVPTATVPTVFERQLLLPGTPRFPDAYVTRGLLAQAKLDSLNGLNGITADDPSDFAVCLADGRGSKDYHVGALSATASPTTAPCPAATSQSIQKARLVLAGLTNLDGSSTPYPVTPPTTPKTLIAKDKVNVVEIPATGVIPGVPLTLNRGSQSDPIFVFRLPVTSITTQFRFTPGFQLTLQGVSPNNIFWVANLPGMQIPELGQPLVGNFIGQTGPLSTLRLGATTADSLKGARILGFRRLVNAVGQAITAVPTDVMTAMTTTDQPLLAPMLQLHSPTKTPDNPFVANDFLNDLWLPHATQASTFNGSFIMGDSPARPFVGGGGETGGGLHNFPRFLEAWEESNNSNLRTTKIYGSFIQLKRSAYATAPYEATDDTVDNSLFFDGAPGPAYALEFGGGKYIYRGGGQSGKAPYYRPPNRQWGYDVGLLSQSPDLFARRFSPPAADTPNEFYREVSRDDKWIQALLCAAQPQAGGGGYEYVLQGRERPGNCRGLGDYTPIPQ
jgi:Tfp pilus assembly protein PilX